MIENDEQLAQTFDVMKDMYLALLDLRKRILPLNMQNYLLMAEGSIDELMKLTNEINEYCGVHDYLDNTDKKYEYFVEGV